LRFAILILGAYLLGSVPFGVILARLHGVDLRKVGSGNIGATNVGRALGKKWGIVCFVLDALKGLVPMVVAMVMLPEDKGPRELWIWLAAGGAAIIGHIFPIYLGLRGGKGVATSLGVVLGLWPYYTVCGLVAAISWSLALYLWRYVSLASMIASLDFVIALVILIMLLPSWDFATLWPLVLFASIMAALVILRHRDNIRRLLAGNESRIGSAKDSGRS